MNAPDFDVFLSHNSQDKPAIEELARRLTVERISPWLDNWNLIPGESWQPAIERGLERCAACAVFIGPTGISPWHNEEMRAAISRRVHEGSFRVIPVLLPGGQRDKWGRLPTFLSSTTWVEFRATLDDENAFHRLLCGINGCEPGLVSGRPLTEGMAPYLGLESFKQEHAPFFFGREALTEWLMAKLRVAPGAKEGNRFLAILGASGSGKSSLAQAGPVPALRNGWYSSLNIINRSVTRPSCLPSKNAGWGWNLNVSSQDSPCGVHTHFGCDIFKCPGLIMSVLFCNRDGGAVWCHIIGWHKDGLDSMGS